MSGLDVTLSSCYGFVMLNRAEEALRTLRPALLALGVALMALAIIGMHQLPSNTHSALGEHLAGGSQPVAAAAGIANADDMNSALLPAPVAEVVAGEHGGCVPQGCEGHALMLRSCLLALTLIVMHWLLPLPRTLTQQFTLPIAPGKSVV